MQIPALLRPMGIDIFCLGRKFLVYNLVGRNLKVKYHRSFFGFFWTLLVPLGTAGVYYFVFQRILKVSIPNYLAFIICGQLPWVFFSSTVLEGLESISGNFGLISKVPVPIQIFPFVGALTNLITLLLSMPVLIAIAAFSEVPMGPAYFFLPIYYGLLFLIAYPVSLVMGMAFIYFRDLRHLMGIFMQLWFWGTPVLYSENMIPERFQWLLFANPVGTLFVEFHRVVLYGLWPDLTNLTVTCAWAVLGFFASIRIQNFVGNTLVEHI